MKKTLTVFLCLLLSSVYSLADDFIKVKLANSDEVEIKPLHFDQHSKVVTYALLDKTILAAPIQNFHETETSKLLTLTTQGELLSKWSGKPQPEPENFPPLPPRGWQLIGWDKGYRDNIQSFDCFDYERNYSARPNSLVNTLKWWDEQHFVKFPQKRTVEKQNKWLHNSVTKATDPPSKHEDLWDYVSQGMFEFSKKYLNSDYLFPCYRIESITLGKLAYFTQGNTAACLSVSIYHGSRYQYQSAVTLISAEPDGRIKFNTRGLKMSGNIVALAKQSIPHGYHTKGKAHAYEIELANTIDLPKRFENDEIRFLIEPSRKNFLYLFLPYQRQKSGVTWIPHPETSTFIEPLVPEPVEPKKEVFLHGTTAVTDFTRPPAPMTRSWESAEGKKLHSTLVQVDGDDTAHFKNGHQSAQVPMHMLSPEDQARAAFWRSSTGPKFTLPAATLCYAFKPTNHAKSTPVKILIHYDGSNKATMEIPDYNRELRYDSALGKLEVSDLQSGKVILLADCAFHKTLKGIEHLNFSDFKEWSPKTLRGYAYRTTKVPHFPTGNTCCANVAANPVTELLGYLLGWSVTRDSGEKRVSEHMLEVFSTSQIYSKRAELTSNLEIARHWGLLPTKVVWSGFSGKSTGSLELVSVALEKNSEFIITP